MKILFPNARIAARWNGALQARLRHAKLEQFLRSHRRKWAAVGEARHTDNLSCATLFFVGGALESRADWTRGSLNASQHKTVGEAACAVSSSLALLIQEPEHWRTAALVATARVLERQLGLSAAAHVAAAAAREFNSAVTGGSQLAEVFAVGHAARAAVESNSETDITQAMRLISQRLDSAAPPAASPPGDAAVDCCEAAGGSAGLAPYGG